jgi:hypothetical protein
MPILYNTIKNTQKTLTKNTEKHKSNLIFYQKNQNKHLHKRIKNQVRTIYTIPQQLQFKKQHQKTT